jgi:tight adherence protein C
VATLQQFATPGAFGLLVGMIVVCTIFALRPGHSRSEKRRLDAYAGKQELKGLQLSGSLTARTLAPAVRRLVRGLAQGMPRERIEATRAKLVQAGSPGGISAIDFMGARILVGILLGVAMFMVSSRLQTLMSGLLIGASSAALGYLLPAVWLGMRIKKRRNEIERKLPDALDMLTISVEAGLAFESAMLRVADRWDNALTRELRQAVLEMRVGAPRDEALRRMAARSDVAALRTFVAVLIQSSQLGVSIAEVLHSQAALMRQKRRQRIEAMAHEAGIKMLFPLVFLVFPALFVFILGPSIPRIIEALGGAGGF